MIDWTHLALAAGTGIITTAGTVAVLKNDVRWIRETLTRHVDDDKQHFEDVRNDIREIKRG